MSSPRTGSRSPTTLSLIAGVKLEKSSFVGWQLLPNLRVAYQPSERALFWAAVSRAVRTPSRIDRELAAAAAAPAVDRFRLREVDRVRSGLSRRADELAEPLGQPLLQFLQRSPDHRVPQRRDASRSSCSTAARAAPTGSRPGARRRCCPGGASRSARRRCTRTSTSSTAASIFSRATRSAPIRTGR